MTASLEEIRRTLVDWIDARLAPGFPAELSCDDETAARVTRRWREYFPMGVEMGDSSTAHLD